MRTILRRWGTWIAGLIAASIPIVDQIDVYLPFWWADWADGLWTIVACALLVWLTDKLRRMA